MQNLAPAFAVIFVLRDSSSGNPVKAELSSSHPVWILGVQFVNGAETGGLVPSLYSNTAVSFDVERVRHNRIK